MPNLNSSPGECLAELMQLVRDGKILSVLKENPLQIVACVLVIAGGILHAKTDDSEPPPPIIFSGPPQPVNLTQFQSDLAKISTEIDRGVQQGILDGLMAILLKKALEMLAKYLEDLLKKG